MSLPVRQVESALAHQDFIMALTDFAIETYHPNSNPCVLMWREFMNRYNREKNPGAVHWRSDTESVFDHWKLYGTKVAETLEDVYKITIVKVSAAIRDLINHGDDPRLDNRKRTAEAYRRCLPHPHARSMGMACFPPNNCPDHPLIIAKLHNRAQSTANGFRNAVVATDKATGYGVLSDPENSKIKENVEPIILDALEDKHPLFRPRALDGPPDGGAS